MSQADEIVTEHTPISPALAVDSTGRRFTLNVGTNVLYLVISTAFNLWFTPYLVHHLGVAVYGFIPLAVSITSYLSIMTQGLNTATGRYLTIELVRGDYHTANRTFNTTLIGSLLLAAALLLPIIVGSILAPELFNVPLGSELDVRWLFLFIGASFLVGVVGASFSVSTFASSRFDLQNWVKIAQLVIRAALTVALFSALSPGLWQVGVGIFLSTIACVAGYAFLWRKLTPQLHVRLPDFYRVRLRELMSMGGWVVLNQIGALLLLNIDLIVVNHAFGAEPAGRYGVVLQLSVLLRTLAAAVSGVLAPTVTAKYAHHDIDGMVRVSHQAMRLMGFGLALPIGLLCGLARPTLGIWLGPSFQDLDLLLIIMVVPLSLNLIVLPLFPIQSSTRQVKWPGIVTLMTGLVNVALVVALASWGAWGMIGVAIGSAITLTIKNAIFTTAYGARILEKKWWLFFPSLMPGPIAALSVGVVSRLWVQFYTPDSWLGLIALAGGISLLYGVILYFVLMNKTDRQTVTRLMPWRAAR